MGSFGNMSQMYNTEPIRFQTLGSIGIKLIRNNTGDFERWLRWDYKYWLPYSEHGCAFIPKSYDGKF